MWSREATIRDAKKKAALKKRLCVAHRKTRIAVIADAAESLGLDPTTPYRHQWKSTCRAESATRQKRVKAALAEAEAALIDERAEIAREARTR